MSVDSSKEEKVTPVVINRVSPRTIPGVLATANKGALDWGWQSFLAYGCHNHVIIVDTQNIKVFQTLEKHTNDIIKVKWGSENYYHDLAHPYTLKLVSLDSVGLIVVWDVKEGKATSSFSEAGKPITDLEWICGRDSCQNLLLSLHPPYSVVLWDTDTGTKVWKKSYTETLLSFAFDPFAPTNVTFLASDCILFVDDFSVQKSPSSNGRKFYISNPSSSNQNAASEDKNKGGRANITKRMWLLAKPDSKASESGVTLNECLNLTYHKSYRHHLLLLYPKEVLILDLEINQTVGIVSSEYSGSPILQVYSCWQRDAFFVLHENGCTSFRLRHRGKAMAVATPMAESSDPNSQYSSLEVAYDVQCASESLRLTKHAKVMGMAACPVSEQRIALLISDGRIVFLEVDAMHQAEFADCFPPYLSASLYEHLLPLLDSTEGSGEGKKGLLTLDSDALHPATALQDNIPPALFRTDKLSGGGSIDGRGVRFRAFLGGLLPPLAPPPHVIRMCPPVTFRNWTMHRSLLAVGNSGGSIQVINMGTGVIEKEYTLHTSPVRGIEWVGLTSFLSYSHPNTVNSSGHVRNELVLTDLQSGRSRSLREGKGEESPIDMIRVSFLRQYVIIAFKEEPFEIWDLRQLILLRTMPKNFPMVTALDWSPSNYRKIHSSFDLSFDKTKDPNISTLAGLSDSDSVGPAKKAFQYVKEHLVFTDTNGQLYHFWVEGNVVKHGTVIPADQAMGSVTCIAWKGDNIVLGDVDGNLNIWNVKDKSSKAISTHRGWIKKIRFGPGKGNMKILVLYNDGVDVFDVKDVSFLQQVRCPREMPRVQDLDWVGSDRPVLATAEGCVRVTDILFSQFTSPLTDYQPSTDPPFCPHILPPVDCLRLKSYLHHAPWCQPEEPLQVGEEESHFLARCPFGQAERCLHVARIFGDQDGCTFWSVALHFLKYFKRHSLMETDDSSSDCSKIPEQFLDEPLDTGYDYFCDSDVYKRLQLERAHLHVGKRTTSLQTRQCVGRLLLLGETERAVQLLLETEPSKEGFYEDCLRACLVSSVQQSGASQSIVKLVSTHLIASGRVCEGVQLLCLIRKEGDACRYLQAAGRWDEAVWLAKSTLPIKENQEILKRWVEYLCTNTIDQKGRGLLALLSLCELWKVVKLLHASQMFERAALFLQSCMEFGLLCKTPENAKDIDTVFMDYSRYLLSIKNRPSAVHYCKLVADLGDDLRKQFSLVSADHS